MLYYPKIPGSKNAPLARCVAFEKLDGTNLHWDWDRDFGWHAFGTRRDAFNLTTEGIAAFDVAHPGLEESARLFLETLAEPLQQVFRENANYAQFQAIQAFTEFLGPNSFAGAHDPADPKRLVLFELSAEGYGVVGPQQFVADYGHLDIPRVVYQGKLTGAFMEAVREGKYNVAEGVVCKGGTGGADVRMVKVKTYAYLERLKQSFGNRWAEYWE